MWTWGWSACAARILGPVGAVPRRISQVEGGRRKRPKGRRTWLNGYVNFHEHPLHIIAFSDRI
jgi:hypothetical protein